MVVMMKSSGVVVPLGVRFRWWVLGKLGVVSSDAFLGFFDGYGLFQKRLSEYLEFNDKAWKAQSDFNGKVREVLCLVEDGNVARMKDLDSKGVYQ